jgi:hypothetical protein
VRDLFRADASELTAQARIEWKKVTAFFRTDLQCWRIYRVPFFVSLS